MFSLRTTALLNCTKEHHSYTTALAVYILLLIFWRHCREFYRSGLKYLTVLNCVPWHSKSSELASNTEKVHALYIHFWKHSFAEEQVCFADYSLKSSIVSSVDLLRVVCMNLIILLFEFGGCFGLCVCFCLGLVFVKLANISETHLQLETTEKDFLLADL